jgi:hypothetical protein
LVRLWSNVRTGVRRPGGVPKRSIQYLDGARWHGGTCVQIGVSRAGRVRIPQWCKATQRNIVSKGAGRWVQGGYGGQRKRQILTYEETQTMLETEDGKINSPRSKPCPHARTMLQLISKCNDLRAIYYPPSRTLLGTDDIKGQGLR